MRLHKLLDDAHARIVRVEADAEQLRSELALRLGQPAVSMPRHAELIGRSVSAALHCPGVLLRTALGAHSDMRVGFTLQPASTDIRVLQAQLSSFLASQLDGRSPILSHSRPTVTVELLVRVASGGAPSDRTNQRSAGLV